MKVFSPKLKSILEYGVCIAVGLIAAFGIKTYVFAKVDVDGQSMMSTLNNNDQVFIEKVSLYNSSIKRGEIVTFQSHDTNNSDYVKRVIGVAGDEIEIRSGKVYLNGKLLKENYLKPNTYTSGGDFLLENQSYKVPAGYIFVMGDNRTVSNDSRNIGPIALKSLNGHVILRVYPFNEIKGF